MTVAPGMARRYSVVEGQTVRPKPPHKVYGQLATQYQARAIAMPPVEVRSYPDAVVDVTGGAMLVYDAKGRPFDLPDPPPIDFTAVDTGGTRRINGRALVMVAPGANLFSHWLFDSLPKLEAIRLAGVAVHDIDAFQVNRHTAGFTQAGLRRFGIGLDRVIGRDHRSKYLAADELIIVTDIRKSLATPTWVIEFSRRSFGPEPSPTAPDRRIYVSRAKARRRRVVNEGEVGALLASFGFTTLFAEELPIEETARVMGQASCIVAPHGAGLANVVFAPPGAAVVEFYGWHLSPEYWLLASQCGLRYVGIEARGPDGRPRSALSREEQRDRPAMNSADIVVDIAVLREALVDLGL